MSACNCDTFFANLKSRGKPFHDLPKANGLAFLIKLKESKLCFLSQAFAEKSTDILDG